MRNASERFYFKNHNIIEPLETDETFAYLILPVTSPRLTKRPIYTTKTSVLGVINTLELAKRKRNFHASTSEVYGDQDTPEKPKPVNPIGFDHADEGKRCAESLIYDYVRVHKIKAKVIRIFNTYGPYMDPEDGRVVTNFLNQALQGQPLSIYGDGSQTRSFCYIDDLVEGILLYLNLPSPHSSPINLGNPEEHRILDLAELVLELTGSKSEMERHPLPQDDPTQRRPDIRLTKCLNWKPTTNVHY